MPTSKRPGLPASQRTWNFRLSGAAIRSTRVLLHSLIWVFTSPFDMVRSAKTRGTPVPPRLAMATANQRSAWAKGHTRIEPAQPAPDQNRGCEESRGSPAYRRCTAYGQPGACTHGRSRRCIEDFHGGRDSQLLVSGSISPARCGPHGASHLPVESSRCKIPLRNSRGAPEFDFLSTLSVTVGYLATFGARDAKAPASPVC